MTSPPQRSRTWCFTLNNYTTEEEEGCRTIDTVYKIFGKEVGDQGTPHLQGYLVFANKKSLAQLKKLLPRAHLESAKADAIKNAEYCSKEGDVFEEGERPKTSKEKGENEKNRWKRALEKAQEGDMEWLEENEPHIVLMNKAKLLSHKKFKGEILEEIENEWWVGPSGTGKSRKAWADYPGLFPKDLNKWWDGYKGQEVVLIEEWSPKNDCTASALKKWADRYPFNGQIKGGTLELIRPKKIIVTSNYTIEECFPDERDSGPMNRRFKTVRFGVFFGPTDCEGYYNKKGYT